MIDTWPEQKHSDGHDQVGTAFVGECLDEIENSTRGVTLNSGLEDSKNFGGKKNAPKKPRKRETKAQTKQADFDELMETTFDIREERRLATNKLKAYKWLKIKPPPIPNEDQAQQRANEIEQHKAYVAAWNKTKKVPENPTLDQLSFHFDIFKDTEEIGKFVDFINKYAKYDPIVFDQLSNINYCRPPELNEIEEMFAPPRGLFEDTQEN